VVTPMMLIRKLLIANRGEIAVRIIRTCRRFGIATTVVYSDADAHSLAVQQADEALHIGGNDARDSYLNIERILAAAKRCGADAIHPGFGFLAENASFARAVIDAGLIWVGPKPSAIEAMGTKREAKLLLKDIPMIPGYLGADQSVTALTAAAEGIGYPLMVKASAGGGGKGMRAVHSPADLPDALESARREAQQSFGDPTLIIEKLIVAPRHVEIQIFGDNSGTVIALGERECSLQRRHQKIIEETPSTALDRELRARMCAAAVSIGQQIGYTNAGTVEFILDQDQQFYFMEMNTRLQVEHPVTEMMLGIDLVEWQLLQAQGHQIKDWWEGAPDVQTYYVAEHAIEVRIYAEDPTNQFLPSVGEVLHWQPYQPSTPYEYPTIRYDSGLHPRDTISPYYDPMIAKLIVCAGDRNECLRVLDYALSHTVLLGVKHNISYLRRLIAHPDFVAGKLSTDFIAAHPELQAAPTDTPAAALYAALHSQMLSSLRGPWWRTSPNRPFAGRFQVAQQSYTVELLPTVNGQYKGKINDLAHQVSIDDAYVIVDGHRQAVQYRVDGERYWVHVGGEHYTVDWLNPMPAPKERSANEGALRAPMTGKITSVAATVGQSILKGDLLLTMEAMKMEHRIFAPYDGTVIAVHFGVGETAQADAELLDLEKAALKEG
jgi:3-methylcrotonyl-CoA carboxylase alpha subunit